MRRGDLTFGPGWDNQFDSAIQRRKAIRAKMPQTLGFVLFTLGAPVGLVNAVALGLGASLINAALAVGLSLAAQLLANRQQPATPKASDVQANIRQAIGPRRRIYSRYLVGSQIVFGFRRGEKIYVLHYIGEGPIEGYVSFRLDRKPVSLDGSGFVTNDQYQVGGRSRVQILSTTGLTTDGPFDEILDAFPELDTPSTPFRHRGCAMVLQIVEQVPAEDLQEVYPNNLPSLQCVVDGFNDIHDPRDESTGLTGNAGLCMLHEIMNVYGLTSADTDEIDFDAFAGFADHCDDDIALKAGGTEKRYRAAGVIYTNAENEDRIKAIADICNADVYMDRRGRFSVRQKLKSAAGIALRAKNGDHLSLQLEGGRSEQRKFNTVKVAYTDASLNWKENEVTWQHAGYLADDGRKLQTQLPAALCPSGTQAQRIGKLFLHENNPEYAGQMTSGPQALELMADYVFTLDLSPEDDFERVASASGAIEYDAERMTVSAPIAVFAADATSWTPATDEQDDIVVPPALPSNVDDVSLTVTVTVALLEGSIPVLKFEWVAAGAAVLPDSYTQQVEVSAAGDDEWFPASVNQAENTAQYPTVVDGGSYDWRIRNVASGATFDWQESASPVTVTVNTTPPADIGFAIAAGAGAATLTVTTPLSNPPAFVRIYRQAGTGGTLDRGDDEIAEFGVGPGGTYEIADSPLSAGDYTWWAEPFNISSVAGTLEGPETDTVT